MTAAREEVERMDLRRAENGESSSEAFEAAMAAGREAGRKGRFEVAEEQYRAALQAAEAFGPEDPRRVASLLELGRAYGAERRFAEAELLFQQALRIQEAAVGPDHPELARLLEEVAWFYSRQGRVAELVPL